MSIGFAYVWFYKGNNSNNKTVFQEFNLGNYTDPQVPTVI